MSDPRPTGAESIDDTLGGDHRRLGLLIDRLRAAAAERGPDAAAVLEEIGRELGHHMAWEEQELFPAVRPHATPVQEKHLQSLEIDHERIRETMADLRSALERRDFGAAGPVVERLDVFLKGHNADEEFGVYILADQVLDPAERRRLLEAFRGR